MVLKSKYSLCIENSGLYESFSLSGISTATIKENPGYIWAPYIVQSSTTIISEGDWIYWERIREIRKRREKIEGIINKINDRIKQNIQ
jgi:hypothetical protein